MSAQHSIADGMKGSAPKSTRIERQQIGNPIEHLPRSFIREGEQENIARIDPVLEQVGYSVG